ncbi:copper oxidase [Candidatus Bathyarchaeota archaeon]|nr:MAG: copper oxidase [Candidatus Bathyarchaeota archaeon]
MSFVSAVKPVPPPGPTLNPKTIPKYTQQLVIPPAYMPTTVGGVDTYEIRMVSTDANGDPLTQQILPPPFPATPTWAYSGVVTGGEVLSHSPAATIEAKVGTPVQVTWINDIASNYMFPVDPTLHWANPNNMPMPTEPVTAPAFPPGYPSAQSNVPLVTHLHGGETLSDYDGGPEQWFTNTGTQGPDYRSLPGAATNEAIYEYLNTQQPATLWYHDHALGLTRINVMSGLAGFYMLRDPADPVEAVLPQGLYEVPLAIQDRSFNIDGTFWFDTVGVNPTVHPYWAPEFFGNTIMVNGNVWPNLNVDQGWYRFRLLDGSNARFYTIALKDQITGAKLPFIQIGSDGGYLKAPVSMKSLTIAPGERADILVDFSAVAPGTTIIVENKAKAPFPNGAQPDPQTTGQIMQFTVTGNAGFNKGLPITLPVPLNPTLTGAVFPTLPAGPVPTGVNPRTLPLVEVMGPLGPLEALLNGQTWMAETTETPRVGDTEDWVIPNLTGDTHPIHLHLVQFQLVSRQSFDATKYNAAWLALNALGSATGMPPWDDGYTPLPLDVTPYLKGKATPAAPNEQGWKDTVQMNPGEVTVIRVRFAPLDAPTTGLGTPAAGINMYPFNPTLVTSPGYVWHCHIIDHEDNEMMRRYTLLP